MLQIRRMPEVEIQCFPDCVTASRAKLGICWKRGTSRRLSRELPRIPFAPVSSVPPVVKMLTFSALVNTEQRPAEIPNGHIQDAAKRLRETLGIE